MTKRKLIWDPYDPKESYEGESNDDEHPDTEPWKDDESPEVEPNE